LFAFRIAMPFRYLAGRYLPEMVDGVFIAPHLPHLLITLFHAAVVVVTTGRT
jgi:hypothetical protein